MRLEDKLTKQQKPAKDQLDLFKQATSRLNQLWLANLLFLVGVPCKYHTWQLLSTIQCRYCYIFFVILKHIDHIQCNHLRFASVILQVIVYCSSWLYATFVVTRFFSCYIVYQFIHPFSEPSSASDLMKLKKALRGLMVQYPNGVTLSKARKTCPLLLDSGVLDGYASVRQLLTSMPDVVTLKGLGVQTFLLPPGTNR